MAKPTKKYLITSDTHFFHKNIIKFCHRPTDFTEQIMDNLLKEIDENTVLIHLGDISLTKEEEAHELFIQKFKCKKILVKGNHDDKSYQWYMDHGWDFACNAFKWNLFGKRIMFTHKPVAWDGNWELNIHGHLHNLTHRCGEYNDLREWHHLISLELNDYKPYNLQKLMEERANKAKQGVIGD